MDCKIVILIITWICVIGRVERTVSQSIETRSQISIRPSNSGGSYAFGASLAIRKTGSTRSDIYIGAPKHGSETNGVTPGALFVCPLNGASWGSETCSNTNIKNFGQSGAIGISVSGPTAQPSVVVCGSQYYFSCPNAQVEQRLTGSCYNYITSTRADLLTSAGPRTCPRSGLQVDIMFVIDQSSSVEDDDFRVGLRWINNILSTFGRDIDSGNVWVGLVTFSSSTTLNIQLGSRRANTLALRVAAVSPQGGGTATDLGILRGMNEFRDRGRPNVPKLMIVMTDGKTSSSRVNALRLRAAEARNNGIIMVAVGIGSDSSIDVNELRIITNDNERVFRAIDFGNLDSILDNLRNVIMETGQSVLEGSNSNTTSELTQLQMGLSTHISQMSGDLYVGAVGAYDRTGTVVEYSYSGGTFRSTASHLLSTNELKTLVNPQNLTEIEESYLGYSVTSGNYFGNQIVYVASGSPRYKSKGAVFIYNPSASNFATPQYAIIHPSQMSSLWQLGAYFGHSVTSVDLNNDNLDDLMVSAPLFSDTAGYDQGRVFVLMNDPNNIGPGKWTSPTYTPQVLMGTNSNGARFGMTLSAAGDVDRNGYEDIVIGAPYDQLTSDDGGSVYIYYGSAQGLLQTRKQKILARSLNTAFPLRSFGASMSFADVDNNEYTDIVVGAPHDDVVVVLRSRPIVVVNPSIDLISNVIDIVSCIANPTAPCSTIRACISAQPRIGGQGAVYGMDLKLLLDAEVGNSLLKRFNFLGTSSHSTLLTRSISSTRFCFDYDIQINVEALNLLGLGGSLEVTPFVQFSYDLTQAHKDRTLSPVLDPVMDNMVAYQWSFEKGCMGANDVCNHDLTAVATYSLPEGGPLILQQNPGLFIVNVVIRNNGPDHSYFTKVNVSSEDLLLRRVTGSCVVLSQVDSSPGNAVLSLVNSTGVLRELMMSGQSCSFNLEYDLSSLTARARTSVIFIKGNIFSNAGSAAVAYDDNLNNNRFSFIRSIRYKAQLSLTGSTIPDAIFFNHSVTPVFARTLGDPVLGGSDTNVEHTHNIYNLGPLLVPSPLMTFSWIAATRSGYPLLYLYSFTCTPSSLCQCDTNGRINTLNLPETNTTFTPYVPLSFPSEKEAILNANPTCNDVMCGMITCQLSDVNPYFTVTVTAKFKVWIPTLSQPDLSSRFVSRVTVDTSSLPIHPPRRDYSNQVSTLVQRFREPGSTTVITALNLGAVIGSVIGGMVLLSLIIAGMWKAGFFKSKYGERKLQAQQSIRASRRLQADNPDMPYAEIE